MPSWGIHLEIANILSEKIKNINKNLFIIGNILPDINNGYVIKDINKRISHSITHYDRKEDYKNYENFYEKYNKYINNELILGYFTHLATDYYYNDLTYSKKAIHDSKGNLIGINLNTGNKKIGTAEEIRQIKVNDFKIFANYIYTNKKLPKLEYNKDILLVNDIIEEIHITEDDVLKTIKYLNEHIENKVTILKESDNKEYQIFTQEEMINSIEGCVNFIIKYLKLKNNI